MPELPPRGVHAAPPFHPVRDFGIAMLLAAFLAALYALTFQERQFGDGSPIANTFLEMLGTGGYWTHVLYFPAARAIEGLVGFENPVRALRQVSLLGGAVGGGGVFVVARAMGAGRVGALAAALLLALSPGWWFFSTTIEVYGLHLACVTFCAALTLLAPWQRPVLAAALAGLALPLVFLSHKSGVFLGVGFVALAQVGRLRRGLPPLGWSALLLGVGPWFLASFLFAAWLSAHLQHDTLGGLVQDSTEFVVYYGTASKGTVFAELWILPLGLLAVLVLAAATSRSTRGWPLAAVVGWSLPPLVFFSLWGLPERGGYALSTAIAWAALVGLAYGPRTRTGYLAWALLVAAQAAYGLHELRAWDAPEWGDDNRSRAAAVERALGPRGTLYSLNLRFQQVEPYLPGVRETNLFALVRTGADEGRDPHAFAEEIALQVHDALARGPVAFDFAFEQLFAGRPEGDFTAALHACLEREFAPREVPDSRWPLVVVLAAEPVAGSAPR